MPTARQIAERALGKALPKGAEVHHHGPTDLVICQDRAYHRLLHKRMRARGISRVNPLVTYTLRSIDPELWRQVKSKAALERISVKALIEQLLRMWLERGTV